MTTSIHIKTCMQRTFPCHCRAEQHASPHAHLHPVPFHAPTPPSSKQYGHWVRRAAPLVHAHTDKVVCAPKLRSKMSMQKNNTQPEHGMHQYRYRSTQADSTGELSATPAAGAMHKLRSAYRLPSANRHGGQDARKVIIATGRGHNIPGHHRKFTPFPIIILLLLSQLVAELVHAAAGSKHQVNRKYGQRRQICTDACFPFAHTHYGMVYGVVPRPAPTSGQAMPEQRNVT